VRLRSVKPFEVEVEVEVEVEGEGEGDEMVTLTPGLKRQVTLCR